MMTTTMPASFRTGRTSAFLVVTLVLAACRADVAAFHRKRCEGATAPSTRAACVTDLGACEIAGEECKFLACVDAKVGNGADDRILMVGQ